MGAADATGAAVQKTLIERVRRTPNITVLEDYMLVDLITGKKRGLPVNRCLGFYALNEQLDQVETFRAPHTILATGGLGQIFLHSTNQPGSVGHGVAMAYRVGARLIDLEYVQFHPTVFAPMSRSTPCAKAA